ncbi:MAG: ATP-binding protein [Methanoregula sp.]
MTGTEKSGSQRPVIGYDREFHDITAALERSGSGAPEHIALVGEPMSGRTRIVNEIRGIYGDKVHYLCLDFVIQPGTLPDFSTLPEEIILIDNCQFLATRKIGGFDVLDTFLRTQINSKKLFITVWNAFSWQYLSSVMNLDAYFPTLVMLTRLDTPVIKQVIMARYSPGEINFLDEGAAERSMFYSIIHKKIRLPLIAREISVPWIKLNFTVMLRRLPRKKRVQISLEDVIFEKINRIARGNSGVALLLWEMSLKDNVIALSAISENPYSIVLDTNESFILSVIISMESLHAKDLSAIAGSEMDIEQVIYRLVQRRLIQDHDGYYSIEPFAFGPVTEYLRKTRRLW